MMKHYVHLLMVLFVGAVSQAQTFNFKRYSEENGLPQNFIYSISQGPERKLYCSTGEGICIFNGFTFSTITNKRIAENFVTTHFVDSRGIVWLGHNQNGITFIRNGNITELNSGALKNFKISMMLEDHKGNLFVATAGGGIFVVDTSFRVFHLKGSPEMVQSITIPYSGCLLAGTNEGLLLMYLSQDRHSVVEQMPAILSGKNVRHVVPVNSQGILYWVVSDENEINGIKFSGDSLIVFRTIREYVPEAFISCIFADRDENLWIGTLGDGLRKFVFEGSVLVSKYHSLKMNRQGGFGSHHVQSIFQDIEGNMWFGTLADGLFQRPLEKFSFYGRGEGLKDAPVTEVIADGGRLWMGGDSGVAVYHPQTRNYRHIPFPRAKKDRVSSMCFDSAGKLWVGTANSGIFVLDTASFKFNEFSAQHNLSRLNVNCVSPFMRSLAVGTTEGLYIINPATGETEELSTNEGLLHNNVLSVFCDSKARLWVASHGAPPYFIENGKVTAYKKVDGLNSFRVNSYCEDKNGTVWIASEGDGVFSYSNNTFRNYSVSTGLLSDYCNGIICSADNAIWVTHRGGLSEKKAGNQVFSNFTEQKGLAFPENALNALAAVGEELWFGTSQGVVNYKLSRVSANDVHPEVFLSSVKFNNKTYAPGELPLQSYGYYSVQFDYLAVMLAEPSAVQYRYRMLGIDTSWRVTQSRSIDFPKLSDGSYTLQLYACNKNSGLCGDDIVEQAFVIGKPVWKMAWFYILLLVAIVGVTTAVVVVRTRALKRTQLLLQLKVKQKTFLLQREKEAVETIKIELEHRNKDITDSINYAKRIQDSILPPEELLTDIFGDNFFVLFKPKDIVSGDFYWAAKLNSGTSKMQLALAAVVDCTGHGVPGAFLSIMANDFLRQSIVDPSVTAPNQVLDFLNEHVSSHLNQSSSKNIMRDGMDIALIGIDAQRRKLYFSGANNPIYIFREVNGMIDQIILTATKQAIGLISEDTVKYSIREFNLVKGDIIYLFSDGYADQFGGENNKKLTYKRFRELLTQAFHMPMHEQKNFLEKAFAEWSDSADQVDDVTIMGIRIA